MATTATIRVVQDSVDILQSQSRIFPFASAGSERPVGLNKLACGLVDLAGSKSGHGLVCENHTD
jgi:hypothetical protein